MPLADTVMRLCDEPSCVRMSGETDTVMDWANSEGPESGGVSASFRVQPNPVAISPARTIRAACARCRSR